MPHLEAHLRGLDGGNVTAWTTANNHKILFSRGGKQP
jgi:hypothetical protein